MLSNAVQLIEGRAIKRHQKAQHPQGFYKRPAVTILENISIELQALWDPLLPCICFNALEHAKEHFCLKVREHSKSDLATGI